MNFLNVFEERVSQIFGTASAVMPFSFKKMAKRAAHEMENETYVINGVDTAPALYTILVSQEDDALMRPVYGELTTETSQFLEAQAQRRGYSFIGQPLVRFMVDPSLKSGRFSAFAENIDARTLERLRDEERRFMEGRRAGGLGGAALPQRAPATPVPLTERAPRPAEPRPARPETPAPSLIDLPPVVPGAPAPSAAQPAPAAPLKDASGLDVLPPIDGSPYGQASGPSNQPVPAPAVPDPYAAPPLALDERDLAPAPSAILIDRQSGRTYALHTARAIIGRERTSGGVILRDPNVSRRHAELAFDGVHWIVTDLNSTNGTLVNDVDVDECTLHDGDVITLGLTNLEFREG